MRLLVSFASGLIFALGLGIGGMTRPSKVIAFLDVSGDWDPSLAFVMIGAIGVHALARRGARGWSSPLGAEAFSTPARSAIDQRLVAGAAIFGAGWGLGGFCPGPAVTALASGSVEVPGFVLSMLAGMAAYRAYEWLRSIDPGECTDC